MSDHTAHPTIVVMAYSRPHALSRLLQSLAKAHYPSEVGLLFVVDAGGAHSEAVRKLATDFEWPYGCKTLIFHQVPLGLFQNFLFCGDLTAKYGSIVLLEDDLYLSPHFYSYVLQMAALEAELGDRVAGVSLSGPWFNGFTHYPFTPLSDGADTYYMQVAWYHGQLYSAAQWARFRAWYAQGGDRGIKRPLHELFDDFPQTDWFPVKTKYLVATKRYYLFPRVAYATNFGDAGTHLQGTRFFQTPLQMGMRHLEVHRFDDALAVYDSFQELLPERLMKLTNQLAGEKFSVDLNGTKTLGNIPTDYVLTIQPSSNPLFQFADVMHPLEINVIEGIVGDQISFAQKADLQRGWPARASTDWRLYNHHSRGRRLGNRTRIKRLFGRVLNR